MQWHSKFQPWKKRFMNECDEPHRRRVNRLVQTRSTNPVKVTVCSMCDCSNLTEQCSKLKANTADRSQFLLRGFNRCHGPIAKTSYCGHSTVKPRRWSTWWMSDRNESSHGFTSFEFMHGEACQGREMMWTLLSLFVKISHPPLHQPPTPTPLASCLKLVICCLTSLCQRGWESRFNICGLTGLNAIRLFCGCKESLCRLQSIILMGLSSNRKHGFIW